MAVAYIANHVAQAEARVLNQYRSAPNFMGLLRTLAGRVQVAEDALRGVSSERLLYGNKAVGQQLDDIGARVGLARGGLDDEIYRILVLGQIAVNYADGSLRSILGIARTVFQASAVWVTTPDTAGHAREQVYAELSLAVSDPKTPRALTPRLVRIIESALAGGVTLVAIYSFAGAGALACDGQQPWVRGLSALDGTGGGLTADIIYSNPIA